MSTYYVGTDLHTRTRQPARRWLGGPPGPTLGLYMITGASQIRSPRCVPADRRPHGGASGVILLLLICLKAAWV